MADFMLEPDEIESDRRRPVHMVSGGLHPTAEVPTKRQAKDTPPCAVPCEACGQAILLGETASGTRLALETHVRTYTVLWEPGAPRPLLAQSRSYPVHRCQPNHPRGAV
jgi:hypothetical protein